MEFIRERIKILSSTVFSRGQIYTYLHNNDNYISAGFSANPVYMKDSNFFKFADGSIRYAIPLMTQANIIRMGISTIHSDGTEIGFIQSPDVAIDPSRAAERTIMSDISFDKNEIALLTNGVLITYNITTSIWASYSLHDNGLNSAVDCIKYNGNHIVVICSDTTYTLSRRAAITGSDEGTITYHGATAGHGLGIYNKVHKDGNEIFIVGNTQARYLSSGTSTDGTDPVWATATDLPTGITLWSVAEAINIISLGNNNYVFSWQDFLQTTRNFVIMTNSYAPNNNFNRVFSNTTGILTYGLPNQVWNSQDFTYNDYLVHISLSRISDDAFTVVYRGLANSIHAVEIEDIAGNLVVAQEFIDIQKLPNFPSFTDEGLTGNPAHSSYYDELTGTLYMLNPLGTRTIQLYEIV